jgi:predicted DNA-binding transcriptional regulator YafY
MTKSMMDSEIRRGNAHGRVLRLLAELMAGRVLTRHSAAQLAGVNHEGAYRMLESLEQHVPGVRRRKGSRPAEFEFEPDEAWSVGGRGQQSVARALAVAFGAAFAGVFAGTDYEHELRKARDEVFTALATKHQRFLRDIGRKIHVVTGSGDVLSEFPERLTAAVNAILQQRLVRLRYRRFSGAEEDLEVKLYSLMVHSGKLYVVGSAAEWRHYPYRLARIVELQPTVRHFEYPTHAEYDPAKVFRDSFGVFVDPEPCRIVVKLASDWRTYALHHQWHTSQAVIIQPDNSIHVCLHVRPCAELEQWVLQFGEHAEVLEPESLRTKVAKRLAAAANRYGPPH